MAKKDNNNNNKTNVVEMLLNLRVDFKCFMAFRVVEFITLRTIFIQHTVINSKTESEKMLNKTEQHPISKAGTKKRKKIKWKIQTNKENLQKNHKEN